MADHDLHNTQHEDEDDEAMMLDPDEAEEVVEQEDDAAMDSGDDDEDDEDGNLQEIQLQNDSVAHFDQHTNSIFCIAQHPSRPELVATGGGDDIGYLWDATPEDGPVLPRSYESDPAQPRERKGDSGWQDECVYHARDDCKRSESTARGLAKRSAGD
nr:putative wd repeat-containing protein c25h1.08c [Quercus suber]